MTKNWYIFPLIILGFLAPVSGHSAERMKAKVSCKNSDVKLVYDCMIELSGKKSGKPVSDVKMVVGADMPSMAMAHNVKPVTAMPMKKPGMYHARITLQMYGEWALKLDLSGARRDRLIHKMHFGGPESDTPMEHGEHKMKMEE